jgi:hypothetical protein
VLGQAVGAAALAATAQAQPTGVYEFVQQVTVAKPNLWSAANPYLYKVRSAVRQHDRVVDEYDTPIGIREAIFDADKGFLLMNEVVATVEVSTAGEPAANEVAFELRGEGKIIGLDSGDTQSHEDYRSNRRKAFNGLCLAIVQSTGKPGRIRVTASSPGGMGTSGMSLRDRARATIEAGYRAFRIDASAGAPVVDNVFNTYERVRVVAQACNEVREGVGQNGDWNVDLHQKFDYPDALRCCKLIEEYEPYLVEDPTRDEQFLEDIPKLRQMTTVPLAAGEEWGQRWNFNRLVENHDIDYNRCTLPNVGGITEFLKIMAMCETHVVGIVPHFTGPISTAALVNCLSTFPGPVLFEFNYGDRPIDYLPECLDFKQGKVYPNERPGLGATLEMKLLKPIGEVTQPIRGRLYQRPDGSLTHW